MLVFLFLIFQIIVILLTLVLICAFLFEVYAALTLSVPFVPVPQKVVARIVSVFAMQKGDVLFDLGCGEGRVLIEAVRQYSDIQAVGVEMGLTPYLLAWVRTLRKPQIRIRREDMYTTDISSATHIYLYLFPKVLEKVLQKIHHECRPGTLVFSCDFSSNVYTPEKVVTLSDSGRGKKLFVYKV